MIKKDLVNSLKTTSNLKEIYEICKLILANPTQFEDTLIQDLDIEQNTDINYCNFLFIVVVIILLGKMQSVKAVPHILGCFDLDNDIINEEIESALIQIARKNLDSVLEVCISIINITLIFTEVDDSDKEKEELLSMFHEKNLDPNLFTLQEPVHRIFLYSVLSQFLDQKVVYNFILNALEFDSDYTEFCYYPLALLPNEGIKDVFIRFYALQELKQTFQDKIINNEAKYAYYMTLCEKYENRILKEYENEQIISLEYTLYKLPDFFDLENENALDSCASKLHTSKYHSTLEKILKKAENTPMRRFNVKNYIDLYADQEVRFTTSLEKELKKYKINENIREILYAMHEFDSLMDFMNQYIQPRLSSPKNIIFHKQETWGTYHQLFYYITDIWSYLPREKYNGVALHEYMQIVYNTEYDPWKDNFFTNKKEKIGRNDVCPCGSGKKYKKCCLGKTPDTA